MRSGGQIRHATLSTRSQLLILAGAGLMVLWTVGATLALAASWLDHAQREHEFARREGELQAMKVSYQQAFGRLDEYQSLFTAVACEVEAIQSGLLTIAERNAQAPAQGKTTAKGVPVKGPRGGVQLADIDCPAPQMADTLAVVKASTPAIAGPMPDKDSVRSRFLKLQRALDQMKDKHETFLKGSAELASANVEQIEETLASVGLSADEVLMRHRSAGGKGGPFIPARLGAEDDLSHVDVLNMSFQRLDGLTSALRFLPLGAPLEDYWITSPFGTRNDPINNLTGVHEGIDLAAAYGSPVMATGDATVTFAGWKSRYGMTVDLDHGMGIRTRYAHLSGIKVAVGQKVTRGTPIGALGDTGRSTGPHLHYEVLASGRPRNPFHFVSAGNHVLEAQ